MKNILKNRRGEGYIDIIVIVIAVVMILSLAVSFFPVLSAKSQLDTFASELCREAEIAGRINVETALRAERLKTITGLSPTISWSRTGNIQFGSEFTLTLSCTMNIGIGELFSFPITLTAKASGKSEVYWR